MDLGSGRGQVGVNLVDLTIIHCASSVLSRSAGLFTRVVHGADIGRVNANMRCSSKTAIMETSNCSHATNLGAVVFEKEATLYASALLAQRPCYVMHVFLATRLHFLSALAPRPRSRTASSATSECMEHRPSALKLSASLSSQVSITYAVTQLYAVP